MRLYHIMLAIVALGVLLLSSTDSRAQDFAMNPSIGSYHVPVKSYKDKHFETVVRQKYDFSCGSAALATLLKYHYNRDVGEEDILKEMYAMGDQEKITREGFSLLDMKLYLHSIGLKADGYRQPLNMLVKAGIPAIVLINNNGYLHFVVIKGVHNGLLLIGDPALGTKVVAIKEFERMWNGILFVILSEGMLGKQSFNLASEWQPYRRSFVSTALTMRELASFTMHASPTPNYFF